MMPEGLLSANGIIIFLAAASTVIAGVFTVVAYYDSLYRRTRTTASAGHPQADDAARRADDERDNPKHGVDVLLRSSYGPMRLHFDRKSDLLRALEEQPDLRRALERDDDA